jgi:hypothetical protein
MYMVYKYSNDGAQLYTNIVPRYESRKAPHTLPMRNKILVWHYQKFEKQKTNTDKTEHLITSAMTEYTDLKPNHNSEFKV